jgi:hypothetical protein
MNWAWLSELIQGVGTARLEAAPFKANSNRATNKG